MTYPFCIFPWGSNIDLVWASVATWTLCFLASFRDPNRRKTDPLIWSIFDVDGNSSEAFFLLEIPVSSDLYSMKYGLVLLQYSSLSCTVNISLWECIFLVFIDQSCKHWKPWWREKQRSCKNQRSNYCSLIISIMCHNACT